MSDFTNLILPKTINHNITYFNHINNEVHWHVHKRNTINRFLNTFKIHLNK